MFLWNLQFQYKRSNLSFTLIELLVVIAILAILMATIVITINPTELLRKSRDTKRISEIQSINNAIAYFSANKPNASTGVVNVIYVSLPDSSSSCANLGLPTLPSGYSYQCSTSSNYRKTDGTGWIPINFNSLDTGSPLSTLPIDPTNTTSTGLYFTYAMGGSWELSALLESDKHASSSGVKDGGDNNLMYEKGTDLQLVKHNSTFSSCQEIKNRYSDVDSGTFYISAASATSTPVYCDMNYSNGGWTLIFSSQTVGGMADVAGNYNSSLSSLSPSGSMLSTWTPFASSTISYVRFACDANKNGSLDYDDLASTNGNSLYAQIKNCTTGLCETNIALNSGRTKGSNNENSGHSDNYVTSFKWGTYDDYPYTGNDYKDWCNGVTYRTRTTYPTVNSASNAYFYIFVK